MSPKVSVLCFGDSLTAGYPFGDSYTAFLAEGSGGFLSPVEPHFGVSGEWTSQIKRRLHNYLSREAASKETGESAAETVCVVVQGGTNDLGNDVEPEEIVENITEMCREAISFGHPVVVCTVPPLSFDVEKQYRSLAKGRAAVNDAIKALAHQFPDQVAVYDFAAEVSRTVELKKADCTEEIVALRDDLRCDSIHLKPEGYRIMGLGIAKTMVDLIHRSRTDLAAKAK